MDIDGACLNLSCNHNPALENLRIPGIMVSTSLQQLQVTGIDAIRSAISASLTRGLVVADSPWARKDYRDKWDLCFMVLCESTVRGLGTRQKAKVLACNEDFMSLISIPSAFSAILSLTCYEEELPSRLTPEDHSDLNLTCYGEGLPSCLTSKHDTTHAEIRMRPDHLEGVKTLIEIPLE